MIILKKKKVIIIGAGVGGLASAARLAKHGYNVTVIEKNAHPGGRCNFLKKNGHFFDTGPSFFLMPDIYAKMFFDLDENIQDHIELLKIDPTYTIYFKDNSKLILTHDEEQMKKQMDIIESNSYSAFQKYLKKGGVFYHLSMKNLIEKDFTKLRDIINFRNLRILMKLRIFSKHYNFVSKFFKSEKLRMAFTFQDFYLGLSPYDAPANFSMFPYIELADGVWLPKGGMYSFVQALHKLGLKFGVEFIFNETVQKINIKGDRATGVTLSDDRILNADVIIANADLTYVYRNLLPDDDYIHKLLNKKYTCSTIMFYWGLDKQYSQLTTHNLFLSEDYKKSFSQIIAEHTLPDDPNFYIHTPISFDSSRAPEYEDTLMVIVPVGHNDEKNPQDWKDLQKKARNIVFQRLKDVGIYNLKDHIKFEISYTPVDWEKRYCLTYGSTLGLAHHMMQMTYFRPRNKHRKYDNLYFVGASTHPGSGVPIVLISSRHTCNHLIHDNMKN
jgi:phytoene desaturase